MSNDLPTRPKLDRSLVNQHSFSKAELVDCGLGNLFGPGRAHLPVDEMLMVDRITEISEGGGAFVMPGCLGLDALWQLVGFWLAWKGNWGVGRALGCGKVSFRGQVLPDAKLVEYEIDLKRFREGKTVLGIADCRMLVDGKHIYTANDVRVGLFTSLDDFSG